MMIIMMQLNFLIDVTFFIFAQIYRAKKLEMFTDAITMPGLAFKC
jgi:hypothetical protein